MLSYSHFSRASRRLRGETGFTLIELLVVVIIIGVLAAIALPIFIDQQRVAVDASVKSDVRNTVTNLNSWRADPEHRTLSISDTQQYTGASYGGKIAKSSANTVIGVKTSTDGNYTVCGFNDGGKDYRVAEHSWLFSSATGRFTQAIDSCPGAVTAAGEDISTTPVAPSFTDANLAAATQDVTYSDAVVADAHPAATYALATGSSLPADLKLNSSTGAITGNPTAAPGDYEVTIVAKNLAGSASKKVTLRIASRDTNPQFTSSDTAPAALKDSSYTPFTVAADGYPAPALSIPATGTGALPTGLNFDATTGKISGTPTVSGGFDVKVTATNRKASTLQTLHMTVNEVAKITTSTINSVTRGNAITPVTIATTGYPAPTVNLSNVPAGMSFVNGTLSGTPTTSQTYTLHFTASNGVGSPATKDVSFTVNEPAYTYSTGFEDCSNYSTDSSWIRNSYDCSSGYVRSGSYALQGKSGSYPANTFNLSKLTAGRDYRITFWVRGVGNYSGNLVVKSTGQASQTFAYTSTYQKYTYDISGANVYNGAQFSIGDSSGATYTLRLDDFTATPLN